MKYKDFSRSVNAKLLQSHKNHRQKMVLPQALKQFTTKACLPFPLFHFKCLPMFYLGICYHKQLKESWTINY